MNLAIIKTGGKQYAVAPGNKIKVEKLDVVGTDIVFSEVLMVVDEKNIKIGTPLVVGATVSAKVLAQGKADKVVGTHYKPKTRNKKKFGHRQPYTEVEIVKIS
jgi:large subunit ribosomal protein L21